MKTAYNVRTAPVLSADHLSASLSSHLRNPRVPELPAFSFQAILADIRPGSFEEMSRQALARRDEQQQLERARRQSQPRAQDLQPGHLPEPQRPPSAAAPARNEDSSADHQGPSRQGKSVSGPEGAAPARSAQPAAAENRRPPDASQSAAAGSTAGTADSRQAAAGPDAGKAAAAQQPPAAQPGHAAAEAGPGASAAAAGEPASGDEAGGQMPRLVADALAQIEREQALKQAATGAAQATATARQAAMQRGDAADAAAQALTADAPEPGSPAAAGLQEAGPADSTAAVLTAGAAAATAAGAAAAGAAAAGAAASAADAGPSADERLAMALPEHPDSGQPPGGQQPEQKRRQAGNAAMLAASAASQRAAQGALAAEGVHPGKQMLESVRSAFELPARQAEGLPGAAALLRSDAPNGGTIGVALPAASLGHSPMRADGSPLLSSRIDSPVDSQAFREQFARQVSGLVVQGQDRAEIRLTPAELGPIRIRVSLNADDAQLDISAAHAGTRAAIESSIQTLRQMLAEQGIRLADYRMDQGQNPAFAQNRQSGQEFSSSMQQSGTASGQNDGSPAGGSSGDGGPSMARGSGRPGDRPAAAADAASGPARGPLTTADGRIDLFA